MPGIDVRWTVEEAWRLATQRVPQPDRALLANAPLKMQIDFEFTNPEVENRNDSVDFVQSLQPTGMMISPTGPRP